MPNGTTQQQPSIGETKHAGSHRTRRRILLAVVAAFIVGIVVLWRFFLPEVPATTPEGLTDRDKSEIAQVCRQHTIRLAIGRLARGDFRWFARSARVLFQQRINRFIDDRDGTYRIYVVVYDRKESDGFYAWYRHQVTKTNGHWTILRSY